MRHKVRQQSGCDLSTPMEKGIPTESATIRLTKRSLFVSLGSEQIAREHLKQIRQRICCKYRSHYIGATDIALSSYRLQPGRTIHQVLYNCYKFIQKRGQKRLGYLQTALREKTKLGLSFVDQWTLAPVQVTHRNVQQKRRYDTESSCRLSARLYMNIRQLELPDF